MDKLRLLEDRLKEKVDVKTFEELEGKVQKLQESINHRVEDLKERIVENETKVEHSGVNDDKGNSGGSDSEEQNEIGTRRNNMIIYRAQDIDSESAEDRESGDALFVHELCIPVATFAGRSHLRSAVKECLVTIYCIGPRTVDSEGSHTLAQLYGTHCH